MAWPVPNKHGVYDGALAQVRRFEHHRAWLEVATLEVAPGVWLLAISWAIAHGGVRSPLKRQKEWKPGQNFRAEFPTLVDALKHAQRDVAAVAVGWRRWAEQNGQQMRWRATCRALEDWHPVLVQGQQLGLF